MQEINKLFLQKTNVLFKKNYKATILFDMDDVIAEFIRAWISVYNKIYNDNLDYRIIDDWNTSKYTKPECGANIYELLKIPGIFRNVEPVVHAKEVLQRLVDNGYEIVFVSDSPPGHSYTDYLENEKNVGNPADDKRQWLKEHFPMVEPKNVIFTSQKWRVLGDVIVDDKPETFQIFRSLGREAILIDQPYNRFIDTTRRAHNLLEAEEKIYKLFE